MLEESEYRKISDVIKRKIREIVPQSDFSDVACFYTIIEQMILGKSLDKISELIKSTYKVNIKSIDLDLYYVTYPIIGSLIKEYKMSVLSEIDELHKMYVELDQREKALKEKMSERELQWAGPLKDIQREKLKLLETLNKIKNDIRKFADKEGSQEQKANAWSPKFARAIGKLITTSMSQKDGKLRIFQPKVIEDKE